MNAELIELLYYVIGGFIISNISLILFQVVSYHPYSRPLIPILVQSISVLLCLVLIIELNEGVTDLLYSLRFGLSQGLIGIIMILPLFYVLMLYFLFMASIRSRQHDPLLALLDAE